MGLSAEQLYQEGLTMRITCLFAALAVALSTSALALEPVKGDDRAFRFTPEEVAVCKAGNGCTVTTNAALQEARDLIQIYEATIVEQQKRLDAEKSKRCI
jgi:hypothetical protein